MKRLSLIGSWKRLGVQVGLLAGVGIAFIGGSEPPPAAAAPQCVEEGQCTFVKPLFLIVADYSTSMNTMFDANQTRWEAAVSAIVAMVDADNGYLQGNVLLGLMRFGHDPNVGQTGTLIQNDSSGITDGQKIDVGFYDEQAPDKAYYQCNGEAIKNAIMTVPAPINGSLTGIGTWTKGAMDKAKAYIHQTWADHPNDKQQRKAAIVLLTDGQWTDPSGTQSPGPANQNPSITAKDLFDNDKVPTYVVAIGEAMGKMFADEIAMNGGTGTAYDAANPQQLIDALKMVVQAIINDVIQPVCAPGLPRIMVLLDASSSMLNINNGNQAGPMGMTGWDAARDALAGANSLFDQVVMGNQAVENLVHLGLAVFGYNMPAPGEQKLLVDYGPCMKDNFAWALDPNTSCEAPGCTDPWGGPPITWTFKDGSANDPPGFDAQTLSHMPKCDFAGNLPEACVGSGTYTHLGLQLVQQNITDYKAACADPLFPYPCDANTKFINILVTDGDYQSTDAQVQAPLQAMYNAGVTTYVIGFGDLVNSPQSMTKLNNMANWGSGGSEMYYDANNQAALEAALANIIEQITFDPCCGFVNCALNPEPDTNEPDPLPPETTSTTSESETDTDTATATDTDTTDTGVTATDTDSTDTDTPVTTTETTDGTSAGPTTDTPPTTTDTPTTSDGTGTSESDTGEPTTGTNPTGGNVGETDGTDTEAGTDSDNPDSATSGQTDSAGGCGCKVDDAEGQTRGLLASLFTFGLAGFIRRRRRA
ncbi:MYXO-CTERM domain-containing protein [Nannocystis exedens]|uniref:MYXO-CTERM domain-containing protein n=1 Tax=Nannocystis exedens TaxID=54 RepID=A0A1I1YJV0_9BACT|nr:VWA domain-containing protein [Nannocystis exedens]PCC70321.1 flagellar biosynthesis protein P [Nannocystis exedens]SFE19826.1 MYXO-CTERM domain-containing protein [Nannocystis exedens]